MENQRQRRLCHDLKTDRQDIGKPLPQGARLLPVLIYAGGLICAGVITWSAIQFGKAKTARDEANAQAESNKQLQTTVQAEIEVIEGEEKKAVDMIHWVDSSRPLQQMIVNIIRCIHPGTNISTLAMGRDGQDPRKVNLDISISNGGPAQVDAIKDVITKAGYKIYGGNEQPVRGGDTRFSCLMVRANDLTK